ncbi:PEP-utilizing enzyme [Sporichthya brevicatena]
MSEATPDVLTPMCWSLWTPLGELGARRAWHELGLLPRSMVRLPADVNGFVMAPFYGRQAINVDLLATLMGALPGTSRQDVERDFMGTVRSDAPSDRAPSGRLPFILLRAPLVLARLDSRVGALYTDQLEWWRRDVFHRGQPDGQALLVAARDRFLAAMTLHAHGRFLSQAVQGAILKLAASAGAGHLATGLYSGFGGVAETAVAEDLWELSRDRLTEHEFLSRHGFHGHDEGNVSGVPWRSDPAPIRALATTLAGRTEASRPRLREQAAQRQRQAAEQELRELLPRSRRPAVAALGRLARRQIRCVERTKAAFLMAIDGARAAGTLLGPELVAAGRVHEPADALFLTIPELLGDPFPDSAELATFRRGLRDHYRTLTVPTTWVGTPTPADDTPVHPVSPTVGESFKADLVIGAPGSSGEVTGRARVITRLDEAYALDEGEILICRHTDPAWVVAMSLADALVIDIGAASSHGAIVARELGIPCVIGTGDGTDRIRTGDLVAVDGTRGEVRILERQTSPELSG